MMRMVSVTIARTLREMAGETPVTLRVNGDCMTPLLESGAVVCVTRQRFYWPGDPLVVHAPDGRLLCHRLIGCYSKGRGWRWLTQADNATRPDTSVPIERIIGKICGGECSGQLTQIPLLHRLKAVWQFMRFAVVRLCRFIV